MPHARTDDGGPRAVGKHRLPGLHVAISPGLVRLALVVRVVAEVDDEVGVLKGES